MGANHSCVLLFSGGRDSTIAAVRLAKQVERLELVTIISPHMVGLEHVQTRIEELKNILSINCRWTLMSDGQGLNSAMREDSGCISCHFGYFWTASRIAEALKCPSIACGFVRYQNHWVEQTPYAISRLTMLMEKRGQQLLLPVADIQSRAEAELELKSYGLSNKSLELKCLRRTTDPGITGDRLSSVVDVWTEALETLLASGQEIDEPLDRKVIRGSI